MWELASNGLKVSIRRLQATCQCHGRKTSDLFLHFGDCQPVYDRFPVALKSQTLYSYFLVLFLHFATSRYPVIYLLIGFAQIEKLIFFHLFDMILQTSS